MYVCVLRAHLSTSIIASITAVVATTYQAHQPLELIFFSSPLGPSVEFDFDVLTLHNIGSRCILASCLMPSTKHQHKTQLDSQNAILKAT